MKKLILFLMLASLPIFGQGQRWDIGSPGSAGAATTQGSFLVTLPNAKLAFCQSPASGSPCTNFAQTYTDITLSTPCPTSTPIVLQGSTSCQATADNQGNMGVWVVPGTYSYNLIVGAQVFGPYVITVGSGSSSINPSFFGPIGLDTPSCANTILFVTSTHTIGGDCLFKYDPNTGQVTWPSAFQITTTLPGGFMAPPGAGLSRAGFDPDGVFRTCNQTGACSSPGGVTTFSDGTTGVPGFPATLHPELGLGVTLSKIAYTVTNVQRTTNVVTITVTTPVTNLNWPVGGTISVFGLPSPYDVLNCAICTLTAVTGGNPSTFTYTLAGADIASNATSGSASIYEMSLVGYSYQFNRLVTSTSNPARKGSIRFAANDDMEHRGCSNTCDYVLIKGDGNDRAQLGDTTGVDIVGPMWGTETTAPSGSASIDQFWPDSTAHRWKMNNNNGSAVTIAALENAETVTGAWTFTNGGAGVTITGLFSTPYLNAGAAVPVIQTVGKGLQFLETSAPAGGASYDYLYADSTAHRWKMNNNNGGAFNIPGISAAATSGNCAKFAANGIDLVDAATTCGGGTFSVNSTTAITCTGGGSANAQTATCSPVTSSLATGLIERFTPTNANTAAATYAPDSLTVKNITKCGTTALAAGDLATTSVADVYYDGTQWELLNPQAQSCAGPLLPSTSFLTVAAGGTASTTAPSANTTKIWAFTVYTTFTTTKLGYDVQTADNSANLYDFGIYNNAGSTLVCDVGATAGSTLMSSTTVKSRAWTASCTLTPGRYYFAVTNAVATGTLGGLSLYPSPVCGVAPSANSTTAGGQLNSSITPAADSYGNCTFPAVTFF